MDWLDDLPLAVVSRIYFQQDGAPAHNAAVVIQFLRREFNDRLIATNGPVFWPPRSPDLTPLDFFLWGTIKNLVYKDIPENEHILRQRVLDAFSTFDGRKLRRVQANIRKRAEICVAQRGGHIEHLL